MGAYRLEFGNDLSFVPCESMHCDKPLPLRSFSFGIYTTRERQAEHDFKSLEQVSANRVTTATQTPLKTKTGLGLLSFYNREYYYYLRQTL